MRKSCVDNTASQDRVFQREELAFQKAGQSLDSEEVVTPKIKHRESKTISRKRKLK